MTDRVQDSGSKSRLAESPSKLARGAVRGRLLAQADHARRNRLRLLWLWRAAIILGLLVLWEVASGTVIDRFWISEPSQLFPRLWQMTADGSLPYHLAFTLEEMAIGLAAGGVLGAGAGLLLGRQPFLAELLSPIIVGIYSLPKIALAPLFILWFGIDLASKIVLVAVIVFFLVFFNTFSGVKEVDRGLTNVLRLAGASRTEIFYHLVLPSAAVWIFTGFRLAVPYALIGAIIGELMASSRGIGYLLQYSSQMFDTTGVFCALFVLMVVSLTLNALLGWLERRLLRWKSEQGRLEQPI